MRPEPITFLWTEIEGFRGFRDPQRVDFGASVVILTGSNGTGKTSVFDAFSDETGRQAHLNGPIAAALMAKASELLAEPPRIEKFEAIGVKLPG